MNYSNRENLSRINDCGSTEIGVPLVVTYQPHLNSLSKMIGRNLRHFHADQLVKPVFTSAPFLSFKTALNLRVHLLRSKRYPLKQSTGYYKCNTLRCQAGKNVKKCYDFLSHANKQTFKIIRCFECSSKCLIYLMSCKVCRKQYVGSTTEKFRFQWYTCKSCQRKDEREEDCM